MEGRLGRSMLCGKWHGPAFLGLLPFSCVCFKKRLGCQLVFCEIPLPERERERDRGAALRRNFVYGHVIVAVNYL